MADEKPGGFSPKAWKARIAKCRTQRDKLKGTWDTNVAYRKGQPKSSALADTDRVVVPIDASFTKQKIAGLFSQVPAVTLTPKNPKYAGAVGVFATELNHILQNDARVDVAVGEVLADVVNAAGIGAVKVGYMATFEPVQVPAVDLSMLPPEQAQMMLMAQQVPMMEAERTVSERFYCTRLSPAQLLWPAEFKGSDFDDAPWLGWDGTMTWARAKAEFELSEDDREKVTGTRDSQTIIDETDSAARDEAIVNFSEIFYKASEFDASVKNLDLFRRVVFVEGKDEPVFNEDLTWQRFDEQTGQYVGVCKNPIRVLTLTYISDEAIPPSDSETGRPQVDETMRSRSQMMQQRDHSRPMRWGDVNRLDPTVLDNLNRGEFQQIIPVQGDGTRIIGEVARANYPREDFEWQSVTKDDLQQAWGLGDNQTGRYASGERSASEAGIVQQNYTQRVGMERDRVAKFFCGIAEVTSGLMQMFYEGQNDIDLLGEEDAAKFQVWDRTKVQGAKFVFSIRQDSTVRLDSQQRQQQLMQFLNLTGKSGFVNVGPVIAELAALTGLDPAKVLRQPEPPPPESINLSLRVSGEDLLNPLVVAFLQKQYPVEGPEIQAAKILIEKSLPASKDTPELAGAPQAPQGPPQEQAPPENWGPQERVTKRVDESGG
jgi:hypothetical protein